MGNFFQRLRIIALMFDYSGYAANVLGLNLHESNFDDANFILYPSIYRGISIKLRAE